MKMNIKYLVDGRTVNILNEFLSEDGIEMVFAQSLMEADQDESEYFSDELDQYFHYGQPFVCPKHLIRDTPPVEIKDKRVKELEKRYDELHAQLSEIRAEKNRAARKFEEFKKSYQDIAPAMEIVKYLKGGFSYVMKDMKIRHADEYFNGKSYCDIVVRFVREGHDKGSYYIVDKSDHFYPVAISLHETLEDVKAELEKKVKAVFDKNNPEVYGFMSAVDACIENRITVPKWAMKAYCETSIRRKKESLKTQEKSVSEYQERADRIKENIRSLESTLGALEEEGGE